MSDAKKMEDTKFYTEMQLATKSLLRQANTKRIAQSHYTAPSFSDQLNMDLDDPGKKRKKKARRPRKDGEAEEPRMSATASGNIGGSDRSSRLSGLLGLHRKKAKRAQKEHIEMPPDVSEERFALMAASVPRGTAGGDHSRSLPLLGVPALEEHQTAPMRVGASQPIRVAAAVLAEEVASQVDAKLTQRRQQSWGAELEALAVDKRGSVPNKYDELPSIQSVEHSLSLARETAAHAAKVATAALDDEAEKAQGASRAGAGVATAREAAYKTMVDDDSEDPRRRTGPSRQRSRERTTFDPRKGQRLALTARSAYLEDQAAFLEPPRKTVAEASTERPVAISLDELVTSAAIRWRHRDETNCEEKYRAYAAELAALELAALETGSAPPEIPVVRRHPVFQRIEHLAWFEISAAVTKARDVDGVGKIFATAFASFGVLRVELFAHATVDHGELALKEITEGPDLSHIKSAPTFIPPTVIAPPVAPKLPQMECILDGVDCFVKGTAIADLGVQCKVWIHRRRCRWSRRSDDFRAWRWRFTIYHVETGLLRRLTVSEVACLAAARKELKTDKRYAEKVEEGEAAAAAAATARDDALARDVFSFFEDDKGKIKPFDVEAGPSYEARRQVVEEDYRCSLVEGGEARGSNARAQALGPVAMALLPLLKLERRLHTTKEFLAIAKKVYAKADPSGKSKATASTLLDTLRRDGGSLATELNLPPVFNPPLDGYTRPDPNHVLCRRFFNGLKGVVHRPRSARVRSGRFPKRRTKDQEAQDVPLRDGAKPGKLFADGVRESGRFGDDLLERAPWLLKPPATTQPFRPYSARYRHAKTVPNTNEPYVRRKMWLRWLVDRERSARAACVDDMRLVFGYGQFSRAEWQFGPDVEDGRDGAACTQEPGYLGVEGRGVLDADGALGSGGAPWEAEGDPADMSPLSLRICEMAGDDDGKVPGVIRVGSPPDSSRPPCTEPKVEAPALPRSQPVGMFVKSEACSSTQSITVSIVLALDEPRLAPRFCAWPVESAVSPSPPLEPHNPRIPPLVPIVVARGHFVYYDHRRDDRETRTPSPAVVTVMPSPLVLVPSESTADALAGRRADDGFRRHVLNPLRCASLVHPESFALKPRVFGVPERAFADAAGPAKPAATERSVAHSVQRCVEQLVRHRDPKDYVYILEVTDFKATGCGDVVAGTGQEKVSRGPEPHVVCSALKAWNEHDYSLDKIKRRSKRAFDVEYAAVGQRRLRTQQRDAVKAQLAAIVHGAAFHQAAAKMTKRKLRAKVLRLVAAASIGGRGIGDSDHRWATRLQDSMVLEKRGVWERREHGETGDVFYYNTDALADPPRLTWDAPDLWSLVPTPRKSSKVAGNTHGGLEQRSSQMDLDDAVARDIGGGGVVTAFAGKQVTFELGDDDMEFSASYSTKSSEKRRAARRAGVSDKGAADAQATMMNLEAIANEKRNEAFVEKLIKDDKLMTKLALQLGYAVQAPVDKRPKDHGSAKAVQERADDPWRREVDGDARDGEWWSDDSDEVGDFEDWEEDVSTRVFPQDHSDARDMRITDIGHRQDQDEALSRAAVPAFVPPVDGVGAQGWRAEAPEYGHESWRRLEFHLRGRYWIHLPRIAPRPDFVERPTRRVTLASDSAGWANRDMSNSLPAHFLVGIHRHSADDRSWGENPTDWRPSSQLPVFFVKDGLDDVERVLATTRRRMDREAIFQQPVQLVEVVERGPRQMTMVDEAVLTDEREAVLKEHSLTEDVKVLQERAIFAARTSNMAELEACQNEKAVVKYLLRRGADINAQNFKGNSSLHFAFGYRYEDLGNYLLSKGANAELTNEDGHTCYEFQRTD
ncbi:hypothetical protein JL721_616 [Aureococcus anophagefferens]|nr:hypothetical protein JL721_616 [Aureococcus anophagefferens]